MQSRLGCVNCKFFITIVLKEISINFPYQTIQIETSHDSCPIRFEQSTKFPLRHLRSYWFLDSLLIIEHTVPSTLGMTPDGSSKVSATLCNVYLNFHFDLVLLNKFHD